MYPIDEQFEGLGLDGLAEYFIYGTVIFIVYFN